jgi:competence protein ComEA
MNTKPHRIRIVAMIQLLSMLALLMHVNVTSAHAKKPKLKGVINLNTATQEQLKLLPRVGPKMAKRILAYRAKQKFKTIREIMKVKGIGSKTFLKMKPNLTVSAKTNVRPADSPS